MRIDLHTHTTRSDGTTTPTELVHAAAHAGITHLGVTDHDTTAGWDEALTAADGTPVTVIPGIELTTKDPNGSKFHMLGYGFDPTHPAFAESLTTALTSRDGRRATMIERLAAAGYNITMDTVLAVTPPGATPGRPHIADALIQAGAVKDRAEAFATLLHDQSPFYAPRFVLDPLHAAQLLHDAGATAIAIAHPFSRYRETLTDRFAAIARIIAGGHVTGIEAHHREHTPEGVNHALAAARDHNLAVLGSSDFHGTGKPNQLAEHTTHPDMFARFLPHH